MTESGPCRAALNISNALARLPDPVRFPISAKERYAHDVTVTLKPACVQCSATSRLDKQGHRHGVYDISLVRSAGLRDNAGLPKHPSWWKRPLLSIASELAEGSADRPGAAKT